MVRNPSKKALYEVVGKASAGKNLEPLHRPVSDSAGSSGQIAQPATQWPKRPRMVQINAGRLEISMPCQLAVAIVMVVILLFLVAYRLGQNTSQTNTAAIVDLPAVTQQKTATVLKVPTEIKKQPVAVKGVKPAGSKDRNRIVIQTYPLRAHLEPVRQYFAKNGITTEIKKIGDRYFLVTGEKYQNPERPGTNGYLAKQRIVGLGAKYEAPHGRETFGSRPFLDAYGMKFDD